MYGVPVAAAVPAMYDLGAQHHSQMYFSCGSILRGKQEKDP